jgi:hypothetical protein
MWTADKVDYLAPDRQAQTTIFGFGRKNCRRRNIGPAPRGSLCASASSSLGAIDGRIAILIPVLYFHVVYLLYYLTYFFGL